MDLLVGGKLEDRFYGGGLDYLEGKQRARKHIESANNDIEWRQAA